MNRINDIILAGDKMKKGILFLSVVIISLFMSFTHVKALNRLYFESENINIKPSDTKEVGVYIESDNDFSNLKLNFITTSNYINFYSIEYNDVFTRTSIDNVTNLSSKTKLKSGTKIATIKLKARDNAEVGQLGYIRAINISLDDIKLQNVSLTVNVNNSVSDNNYLKSITSNIISLDFNKDITDYKVDVDENIETLDLNAIAEDSKANVVISDQTLKLGKNIIKITVEAENKETRVYTITVNKKSDSKNVSKNEENSKVNKTNNTGKGGFTMLLIILIIVLFVDLTFIKNKKNK